MAMWDRLMNGLSGFRQGWLNADPLRQAGERGDFDAFSQWESRKLRYDVFWAFYQNNTFQKLAHAWSSSLKADFGLYKHTRNVFCPGKRLGDFWGDYPYCGELDPLAGDGRSAPSAIPIEGASPSTRKALARIWRDSRWQVKKSSWTRDGAVYGDSVIKLVDDPIRKRITKRVIHPGHVKWIKQDDAGRVLSYIIEEQRYDPRTVPIRDINPVLDPRALLRVVTYNEECFVEGDRVVYRTFLNGAPFDWRKYSGDGEEGEPEWDVPYSVVPMVWHQHKDIGIDCGLSEFHSLVSKVFEVDDMASGLGDQIRKIIRAPWVIFGAKKTDFTPPPYVPPPDNPMEPGYGRPDGAYPGYSRDRDQLKIQTVADPSGKAQSLVADLKIEEVGSHIERINEEIERDYPELQMDIWATADVSGRALREARKRVVTKVQGVRAGYDLAHAEADRIALYIQSVRGYEGCVKGVEHPDDDRISLAVGCRPVFKPDPLDDLEEDLAFWQAAGAAKAAGAPLRFFLEDHGWSEDKLLKLDQAIADQPQPQPIPSDKTIAEPAQP